LGFRPLHLQYTESQQLRLQQDPPSSPSQCSNSRTERLAYAKCSSSRSTTSTSSVRWQLDCPASPESRAAPFAAAATESAARCRHRGRPDSSGSGCSQVSNHFARQPCSQSEHSSACNSRRPDYPRVLRGRCGTDPLCAGLSAPGAQRSSKGCFLSPKGCEPKELALVAYLPRQLHVRRPHRQPNQRALGNTGFVPPS
jgi:hypothetical protein